MVAANRLAEVDPELAEILTTGREMPQRFDHSVIRRETVWVTMRDGVRLATDLYRPHDGPAPAIAMRTPYGRAKYAQVFNAFAQSGYIVISQDCRGTGDSEPEEWDYYVYEREDSFDFVEWATRQPWFNGFLGGCGGSYVAQTQWCMAFHPLMSAIAPEVGGLGVAFNTAYLYMYLNSYACTVGKGADKIALPHAELESQMLEETLAGGYYNEPLHPPLSDALLEQYPHLRALPPPEAKRWLWGHYSALPPRERSDLIKKALGVRNVTVTAIEALPAVFGHQIAHDAHMFPVPEPSTLCRQLRAPVLMITGWYDWGLHDALKTWTLLKREAPEPARSGSRLIIAPSAHNKPGYHEGTREHPELERVYRTQDIPDLLLHWYETRLRASGAAPTPAWPPVIYYLLGANEWRAASDWPPRHARRLALYLGTDGTLTWHPPTERARPDEYTYDPCDPTPTVGGSIVSNVYRPGSVDVSEVQKRVDVLTYTSAPLDQSLDVAGPLRMILFASSSARDTDFVARLSDVFPDGRAIQLQSGILRARYRNAGGDPEFLVPGRIYRFEIDLWATANRFESGHAVRIDISSADFPHFDRNSNRGDEPGDPVAARQTLHHDVEHPSHLVLWVLGDEAVAQEIGSAP